MCDELQLLSLPSLDFSPGLKSPEKPGEEWLKILQEETKRAASRGLNDKEALDDTVATTGISHQTSQPNNSRKTPSGNQSGGKTDKLRGYISLLAGCHGLGIKLDTDWALDTLRHEVDRACRGGNVSRTALLQACSAGELAGLAGALSALSAPLSGDLLSAYAQAVWPKLGQMEPHQVMQVLNGLAAWGYPFPAAMVASFSARLAAVEVGACATSLFD